MHSSFKLLKHSYFSPSVKNGVFSQVKKHGNYDKIFRNIIAPISVLSHHRQLSKKSKYQDSTTLIQSSYFSNKPPDGGSNLSLYQRFKLMYKEYWYVLLPVHVATSSVWLGGFYYLAIR